MEEVTHILFMMLLPLLILLRLPLLLPIGCECNLNKPVALLSIAVIRHTTVAGRFYVSGGFACYQFSSASLC